MKASLIYLLGYGSQKIMLQQNKGELKKKNVSVTIKLGRGHIML